jgi:long-chain fatty acid transport protein
MPLVKRIAWTCGCLVLLSSYVPLARADGFRNPFQSAAAIGQGTAFAAQADDPSAIHYNPAGMTQLRGIQHSVGVEFVSVNTRYTSPTGVTSQNDKNFPVGLPPPGQLFVTANLKDLGVHALGDLSVGIGLENLYGFSAKYPENGPFATAVTRAQLPLLDIKPTVAYKLNNYLSVGLGADIFTFASFLGEGQAEQHFLWPGGLGVPAGSKMELNGKGTTAAMNASVLFTPWRAENGKPRLNLGFVWRSQAVLPLEGALLANGTLLAKTSSSIRFPEDYAWAVAAWPVRNREREWKMEVDVDFVRWQSTQDQNVSLSNGITLPNPQHWHNAVTVSVGTEYKWLDVSGHPSWEVAVRAGYLRSMTPFPDANFNPAIPDADSNNFTAGLGLLCKPGGTFLGLFSCGDQGEGRLWRKAIGLDLAYAALVFERRTVSGNPNPTVDGTYRSTNHVGALTLRVNF